MCGVAFTPVKEQCKHSACAYSLHCIYIYIGCLRMDLTWCYEQKCTPGDLPLRAADACVVVTIFHLGETAKHRRLEKEIL